MNSHASILFFLLSWTVPNINSTMTNPVRLSPWQTFIPHPFRNHSCRIPHATTLAVRLLKSITATSYTTYPTRPHDAYPPQHETRSHQPPLFQRISYRDHTWNYSEQLSSKEDKLLRPSTEVYSGLWFVPKIVNGLVCVAGSSRQLFVAISQSFIDFAHSVGAAIVPRGILSTFGATHVGFYILVQRFWVRGVNRHSAYLPYAHTLIPIPNHMPYIHPHACPGPAHAAALQRHHERE